MSTYDDERRLRRSLIRLDASATQRTPDLSPARAASMPDIITFATGPDFLNLDVYPRQGTLLKIAHLGTSPTGDPIFTDYDEDVITEWIQTFEESGEGGVQPDLRERIAWNLQRDRRWFREIVFVGGRRCGKGFLGSILFTYHLWWLLSLGNPQAHLGIPPNKRIVILIFAGQHDQAKANQWRDVCDRVLGSECFYPFHPTVSGSSLYICSPHDLEQLGHAPSQSEVQLGASLEVRACGATTLSGRGPACIGFAFDEMSHAHNAGANRSAEEIYEATVPSLDQFGKEALIYEASSAWIAEGQFYENWRRSLERDLDGSAAFPDMTMWHLTAWDPYVDWQIAHQIPTLPGGAPFPKRSRAPQVYDDHLEALERANPESFATERRSHWRRDTDSYLTPTQVARLFAPVQGRVLQVEDHGTLDREYFAHGDPGRSGANFAYAIGHREVFDGQAHVVFDYFMVWRPQDFPENNYEINYRVVTDAIKRSIDAFNPVQITFDHWNSASLIDELREYTTAAPLPRRTWVGEVRFTQRQSFDNAETLKTGLGLGRVHAPYHPVLEKELLGLRFKGSRVEHAAVGECTTKDLADAVMAITKAILGDDVGALVHGKLSALELHASAPGGYMNPLLGPPPGPGADLSALGRALGARTARSRETRFIPNFRARGHRRRGR